MPSVIHRQSANFSLMAESKMEDEFLIVDIVVDPVAEWMLHWGLTTTNSEWTVPCSVETASQLFEAPTTLVPGAAQTPFTSDSRIRLKTRATDLMEMRVGGRHITGLAFVLHKQNEWVKDGASNFFLPLRDLCREGLPDPKALAAEALCGLLPGQSGGSSWFIGGEKWYLAVATATTEETIELAYVCVSGAALTLHWGLASRPGSTWLELSDSIPSESSPDTLPMTPLARQTPFVPLKPGVVGLKISLAADSVMSLSKEADLFTMFVVKSGCHWFKCGPTDFNVMLPLRPEWLEKKQALLDRYLMDLAVQEKLERRQTRLWERALHTFREGRKNQIRQAEESKSTFQRQSSLLFLRRMGSQSNLVPSAGRTRQTVMHRCILLSDGKGEVDFELSTEADLDHVGDSCTLDVNVRVCTPEPFVLHWGVHLVDEIGKKRREWAVPDSRMWPAGTKVVGDKAVETCLSRREVDAGTARKTSASSLKSSDGVSDEEPFTFFVYETRIQIPAVISVEDDFHYIKPDLSPDSLYPWALTAVLKSEDEQLWVKDSEGHDLEIPLVPSLATLTWRDHHPELVDKIVEAEVDWSHMTLMHRQNLINSLVSDWLTTRQHSETYTMLRLPSNALLDRRGSMQSVDMFPQGSLEFDEDDAFWSWLVVWMRFSQLRLLTWQRNYNTKPRELAASAEAVTFKIARAWAAFPRTSIRSLVRLMLCMMSRGGNKGQAIRDEILNIMHRHKIPEHGAANFFEQWHQKLHNNTTPDDIGICEGLLAFLRSGGNMDAYRGVLARHKITPQRLASYERPVRNEPFVPHCDTARLIHDFEHYLDILKDVHESLDLQKSMERARPFLRTSEGVVQKALRSLSSHRDRPTQVFFAITDARRALSYLLNDLVADTCAIRELLFLDFAFEQQQSFLIQALGNNNLPQSHGALHTEVAMLLGLLESMVFHRKDDSELRRIEKDWRHWAEMCIRWGDHCQMFSSEREAALLLMALVDRLSRWVSNHVFQTTKLLQDKAEFLAVHVLPEGAGHPQVAIFVEEILRSSISFALSLMLKRVEPVARKAAELSSWQLISVGRREPVDARLVDVESLYDMQHVVYPEPTVLLSGSVSGEEDIPQGVVGVIVKHSSEAPDILSHVAVRARNSGVFLVVCYEPAFLDEISQVVDTCQRFSVDTGKGDLKWSPVSEECLQVTTPEADRVAESKRTAWRMWGDVDASLPWLIEPKDFTSALVGGKSLNLQTLKASLEELGVKTPAAFALPYGVFNKILNHRNNSEVQSRILASFERLQQASDFKSMECCLTQIADCLDHALPPPGLSSALRTSVAPVIEGNGLFYDEKGLWSSIVGVYQSQFSLRPWLSLTKAGKDYSGLMMAVLVQDLVPATFAFVLHSQNPASIETEMYGELVSGLGETLVSNEPGQALSWTCKPDDSPKVRSFFSKSVSLQPGTLALIARSDSNSEDLDGFAGAGLFESLTVGEPRRRRTCYSAQGSPCHLLVTDLGFRQHLLSEISRLAFKVQELMGTPVDVEGCVVLDVNEKKFVVHVVQARPQV